MRGFLLSPASALSLAGLLFIFSLPLATAPEGPEHAFTPSPSAADPTLTQTAIPEPTESDTPSPAETSTPSASGTPEPTESSTPSESSSPTPAETSTPSASDTPASNTSTPIASETAAPTASGTLPVTPIVNPTGSPTISLGSATLSPSPELTASLTQTTTPSTTPSPSEAPPTAFPPQSVLINELAWSGSITSSSDEWIELQNLTSSSIDLSGWRLTDGGDINVALNGTLPAFSYFLLERTDDSTISNISANQIYTGALSNSGERVELLGPSGAVVDTANADGGGWPAGDASPRKSMERRGGSDIAGNWGTFTGIGGVGHDVGGNLIAGTPRQLNSVLLPTATPTPFVEPTDVPLQTVLINEVAWAGTLASSSDEWIELHNPGATPISLAGWNLTDGADVFIRLSGTIAAYGFYLLERTDDSTVSDIAADVIYTGSLRDSGEILQLTGPTGDTVDSANADGGNWPAGSSSPKASMERRGGGNISGNWGSYTGYFGNGLDALRNPIRGTPLRTNSLFFPTPTPTSIPSRIVINEVLIRPRYDWEGTGGATTADEFIELYNAGPLPVHLKGWWLDDVAGSGSKPYDLPGVTISPRGFVVFFRTKTKIALNDTGDTVRLMAPNGRLIDRISYLRIRAANLSYGRLTDGSDNMRYGLWPTPGMPNLLFEEPEILVFSRVYFGLPCVGRHLLLLERATRHPAQVAWLREMNFVGCEIQNLAAGEGM